MLGQGPLGPVLDTIERLSAEIARYDAQMEATAATRYPETQRVRQVAGVGPLTALCFVLTLEDPARFRRSRSVGGVPRPPPTPAGFRQRDPTTAHQQGWRRDGAQTPGRRRPVRPRPVRARHGPAAVGLGLAARGGRSAKKRAVVATARKLAVLLHRLWTTGAAYVPLRAPAPAPSA